MITANRSQIQKVVAQVEPLRIWLRPMGKSCKVRINRMDDANWLRAELLRHGVECTKATPIAGTDQAVLIAKMGEVVTFSDLEGTIRKLDSVTLMLDPA